MTKRTIKLEFEYIAKPYIEPKSGAECYQSYVRPTSDHDFWRHIFKKCDEPVPLIKSLATIEEADTMADIAMQLRDAAIYVAGERGLSVKFSENASFHKSSGEIVTIKPATFTPH